jgi:predicted Zn-ribbon and HTH transcriptional regulator
MDDFPVLKCKVDPSKEVYEYTSKRGTVVTWSLMTGEARLKFESNPTTTERATAALMMRVKTVNGEPATKEVLQDLGMMDRREIRDYMVDQEGGIETTFDAECNNCGHEFKSELRMAGFDFFAPSETLED